MVQLERRLISRLFHFESILTFVVVASIWFCCLAVIYANVDLIYHHIGTCYMVVKLS